MKMLEFSPLTDEAVQQLVSLERCATPASVKILAKLEKIISVGYVGLLGYGTLTYTSLNVLVPSLTETSFPHWHWCSSVERAFDCFFERV